MFAPVSRILSLRILLALATLKYLRVFAWDVDSTYLHGKINHDIYISFLDGYDKLGKVGKLNKVLHGLLEATHIWREDLEEKLKSLRFAPLESDTGVFLHKSKEGITAIDMHVDDSTRICSSEEEESKLKVDIQKFYRIKRKIHLSPSKFWEYW